MTDAYRTAPHPVGPDTDAVPAGLATEDVLARTASELVAGFSTGELSPVAVTTATLRRIDKRDGELNAYCLLDRAGALEQAEQSEQRWAQGNPIGLLDGVPVAVKDLLLLAGAPTRRGSRTIEAAGPWSDDSPATARLREHGAVLVGKTTTPEFGWKAVTDSPLTGLTRNPWAPDRTPGGSSGGSAAAVAAGLSTLAIGTDGGGSIRIPAAFCGIVGFKPTYGRVPAWPPSPFGLLSHVGPMARSVDDVALALDVLSLRDPRDPAALAPPVGSYREAVRRPVRGLVAAYSATLGHAEVDAEVAELVDEAVNALSVEVGLRVELADPEFADPLDTFETLWSAGASHAVAAVPPDRREQLDPGLRRLAEAGDRLTLADYQAALDARTGVGVALGEFHERYDVLLTPTVPIPAFAAGHDVPPGTEWTRWPQWTPFSYPFNLTGQPAATVPVGQTADGRPVGLQVVGPRHSDDLVLAVCRALEAVRPWPLTAPDAG
ncbi:amidase [Actinocatenispora thailandica]|nr:amidase [Actinocatenispora thailandica]